MRRPHVRRMSFEPLEPRSLMAALSVPQLSSRPGAAATLYLDFNGHAESRWGGYSNVVTPAYDTDGNRSSFSSEELSAIREIWSRVAEDYAPFKINVTTVAPPLIADRVAVRVAIGGSYSDWYGRSAGGVSFVGGFTNSSPNVAYAFSASLAGGDPRFVAEAASHEAGHLFGLDHQATWSGGELISEYSTGTAALAPIMGVGYYAERTRWSVGPTTDGPTSRQDDLAILASTTNGFGYAADDFGNTLATAAALPVSGASVNLAGLIGRNDDRDVFKFTTSGGGVRFTLGVAPVGANLDGVLELQNSLGKSLIVANPSTSSGATLSTTLAAGTYYLVVRSSGGYGNLGRYTLAGSVATTANVPVPPPAVPPDQGEGEGTVTPPPPPTTTGLIVADNGDSRHATSGTWQRISGPGYASDVQWSAISGATSTWTFAGLAPGQYRVAATWTGSQFNATDAPFSILSGSQLLSTVRVNQQKAASTFTSGGADWQNLGTFTIQGSTLVVRLNNASSGRVVADAIRLERVYSTTGGTAYSPLARAADDMGVYLTLAPPAPVRRSQPLMPAAVDAVLALS
jgi:hypothetical protein